MKRNPVEEINELKNRSGYDSYGSYRIRMRELQLQLEALLKSTDTTLDKQEMIKYFPLALAACGEVFFRSLAKELIDAGKPYSTNAAKFNQTINIKFDFEIVLAIHGQNLSIGEVIAHFLPFNNLQNIDSNFSVILGSSFLNELKAFQKKTKVIQDYNEAIQAFHSQHKTILKDVERLYELRHIFAHEVSSNGQATVEEIQKVFNNTIIFFVAIEWFLANKISPNAAETATEVRQHCDKLLKKEEDALDEIILELRASPSLNGQTGGEIDKLVKVWKVFRDQFVEFEIRIIKNTPLEYISRKIDSARATESFRKLLKPEKRRK